MMKPAYYIHPGFPKCLALGHTLGIIPYMYALKEDPKPGDKVVLFGGLTGRDGVHGATASSAAMTSETLTKDKAAVQIGLPIIERKFMTAVPEWRDRSCLRSITDLGAGGISCAVGELGKRGVKIHSDRVPLKDSSLSPWEILLSESQERMLAAVPPEKIDEFIEIAEKYDIQYTILGEFNDSGKYSVFHGDEQFVDLDMNFLWKQCPIDNVIVEPAIRPYVELNIDEPTTADEWRAAAIELLRHWHCCDQSAAGTQFDSTVQGQTVVGPYGGAHGDMPTGATVLAPLEDAFDGVAFSIAYHPYYGDLDPAGMARLAVIEAIAKLISAGVPLSQIGLCDNFYAPKIRPDVAADLVGVVDVICEASEVFGTPFISGKDSSSGTFKADDGTLIDVPFSLVVAGMGILPDVRKTVTSEFKEAGNQLIYVGACWPNKRFLGASTYAVMEDKKGGRLPRDGTLSEHKTTFEAIHELMERGLVRSASAMTSGGIWASIFKSCLGSDLGAELTLNQISDQLSAPLFGEAPGGFILEFDQKTDAKVLMGLDWCEIGTVTQDPVVRVLWRGEEKFQATVEELAKEWRQPFAEVIG
ncbi:MAG: AIR synthase-related protein [bacterium]|nr:AIR synthase-related protein [bacterium]